MKSVDIFGRQIDRVRAEHRPGHRAREPVAFIDLPVVAVISVPEHPELPLVPRRRPVQLARIHLGNVIRRPAELVRVGDPLAHLGQRGEIRRAHFRWHPIGQPDLVEIVDRGRRVTWIARELRQLLGAAGQP